MKRFPSLIVLWLTAWGVFAGEPVFFVQLTDPHLGMGDNVQRTRAVVAAINALPMEVAFVAVTGDMMENNITDSAAVDEAQTLFDELNMPVYFVPGNHDLLKSALAETVAVYTNRFGPLIFSVESGGVDFVFVCTEPLTGRVQIPGFDPLLELDALLTGRPAVVFHHTPSVDDFYNHQAHDGWGRSPEGKQWVELLNRHAVKAVIAGHFHRDECHWLGAVPLYICPPVSARFGRQAAFRIYNYQEGRIGYRTQYVE
jgi:hypothetical protein